MPYVVKLLKVTFEERKGTVLDKLPVYFLNAECVSEHFVFHSSTHADQIIQAALFRALLTMFTVRMNFVYSLG